MPNKVLGTIDTQLKHLVFTAKAEAGYASPSWDRPQGRGHQPARWMIKFLQALHRVLVFQQDVGLLLVTLREKMAS